MSTRSIASILFPGLLLLSVAFASNATLASAQAGASITATPTGAPDTYTIVGTGFPPNATLRVGGVTCDELPCAAGGGGGIDPAPITNATGGFTAVLKLDPLAFRPGQTQWLIAASPGDGPVLATAAQVRVPAIGVGGSAPGAPATGNSGSPTTNSLPFGAMILAALGLAAASASIVGLTAVRRR
ncbi:MAG: hypothetical protein ABIQ47_10570 [Tepidiformaceae bacterium]